MADNTGNERRIEMRALEQKIDGLSALIKQSMATQEKKIDKLEVIASMNQIAIASILEDNRHRGNDVVDLEKKVNGWSSLNSLGVVLAGILATLGAWLSGK